MNFNSQRNLYRLIILLLASFSLNTAISATSVDTLINPIISNAKVLKLVSGSILTATWPAPIENTFKIWVQIPAGSHASNVTYWVYPKGNAIGSNACNSNAVDYPCYPITVDQSVVTNGWTQLKINNLATTSWAFAKSGYVTTRINTINLSEQLGIAQVSYQSIQPNPNPTPITFSIGQAYQGGKIFYLDSTGQHGLIAAPTDQSAGIQWWNGTYKTTGATGTTIGTGKANTTAIVQAQGAGSYAAKLCNDLVLGGYSDWYLPSKDELNRLYLNKSAVSVSANSIYWSSSELGSFDAWYQIFYSGYQNGNGKDPALAVRAVRSF